MLLQLHLLRFFEYILPEGLLVYVVQLVKGFGVDASKVDRYLILDFSPDVVCKLLEQ